MKYSFFEVFVGAFILATCAFFLLYMIGFNNSFNNKASYTYHAIFDEIGSIDIGADVKIGGVKSGEVIEKKIMPQTFQTILSFTTDKQYPIPLDSQIVIDSHGLLGVNYVKIVPGHKKEFLKNNAQITNVANITPLEELIGKAIFIISETATQQ